jgi:septal ring factor EnvC (AmiA/AmiB activator)
MEISSGALTPTHMLAVVSNDGNATRVFPGNHSPEACVRDPARAAQTNRIPDDRGTEASRVTYDWRSWPYTSERELLIACRRLAESAFQLKQRAEEVAHLETEIKKRTCWARNLEKELEDRTRWALTLQSDLEKETAWAVQLSDELDEKTRRLSQLERELHRYLHYPLRFLARLAAGVYRRARRILAATTPDLK